MGMLKTIKIFWDWLKKNFLKRFLSHIFVSSVVYKSWKNISEGGKAENIDAQSY